MSRCEELERVLERLNMRFYRVEHREDHPLGTVDYNYASTLGSAIEMAKKYAAEEEKDINSPFYFCIWEERTDDPNYQVGTLVAQIDWFGELIDLPHKGKLGWEYDPETLKPRYPNPNNEDCTLCRDGMLRDRKELGVESNDLV